MNFSTIFPRQHPYYDGSSVSCQGLRGDKWENPFIFPGRDGKKIPVLHPKIDSSRHRQRALPFPDEPHRPQKLLRRKPHAPRPADNLPDRPRQHRIRQLPQAIHRVPVPAGRLLQRFQRKAVQIGVILRDSLRHPAYGLFRRGIQLPQHRNDIQPDPVPGIFPRKICTVRLKRDGIILAVFFHFPARDPDQRPDNIAAHRRDPTQSSGGRPCGKVVDHRLHAVGKRMGRRDPSVRPGKVLKKPVPHRAAAFLDPLLLFLCQTRDIRVQDLERDPVRRAPIPHKALVAIRLRAAQSVVDVRREKPDPLDPAQKMQQGHGIRPARNSRYHIRALGDHPVPFHSRYQLLFNFADCFRGPRINSHCEGPPAM